MSTNTFVSPVRWCLTTICAASLVACGGSDDPSPTAATTTPGATTQTVSGVLVSPTTTAAASHEIVQGLSGTKRQRALSVACPNVPDGYDPMPSVALEFRDSAGVSQATLTTDTCGGFSGSVPASVTTVTASSAQSLPISQPISTFSGSTPTVLSSLPTGASLVISVLQDLGGGKVAITVTDSATGKAVLGLTQSNFGFALAATALTPASISYGASTAQAATVGIVLDASGSMHADVGSTGKTSFQLASAAAQELLDGLTTGQDEAGVVIFDNKVVTMNNAALAGSDFAWGNAQGASTPAYTVSASGLTTSIVALRPLMDLYSPYSQIYFNAGNTDPVNAGTGSVRLLSDYAFGGSTSFYDATSSGLDLIAGGVNKRRIVVAMTDGQDNASVKKSADVIAQANTAGVPLYLVAFGSVSNVDEPTMQAMAQQTGGEYKRVEGDDITGLFQSIQTGIRFQYVASFPAALSSNSTLTTTVTTAGLTTQRDLVIR